MNPSQPSSNSPSPDFSGYSFDYRKRRKADWAGIQLGDAFRANGDFCVRLPAQRLFYQMCKKFQQRAAAYAGESTTSFVAKVKAQLSPCYTSYPSATLAARAALGLTAFLEFQAHLSHTLLATHLQEYLKNPAEADEVPIEPEAYKKMATMVTEIIQRRLLFEELVEHKGMEVVEFYRLFAASMQTLAFRSVPEIIQAVVFYGDILLLPPQGLHPIAQLLLHDIQNTCGTFLKKLPQTDKQQRISLGQDWVRTLCQSLSKYLPLAKKPAERSPHELLKAITDLLEQMPKPPDFRFSGEKANESQSPNQFPPLENPVPPALFPPTLAEQWNSLLHPPNNLSEGERSKKAERLDKSQEKISEFSAALQKANQQRKWEDMRYESLEDNLRDFQTGPIEGTPNEGHEVKVRLDNGEITGGEIFDRPLELSEDWQTTEQLIQEAQPITEALRRILYPNVEQVMELERLKSSGSLNPSRLPLADVYEAVFQRHRAREKADRRGKPVVLLACDGSGSLNDRQMKMLKLLATAWLMATSRSSIQLLAALYHSGDIRRGVSGPLVQWIYHQRKTPAVGRPESVRALASLPTSGTGVQSDALSLAFLLEEARRLARGKNIFLVLLTDTAWNVSFRRGQTGEEEMCALVERAYLEFAKKLHITLVTLGAEKQSKVESLVDRVIAVKNAQLHDVAAVAQEIGVYVASCLMERRNSR